MFDYHVHSCQFSGDASMSMEEAIETAIKRNILEICFTDHTDYDYDGLNNDYKFNYEEYFKTIDFYKNKYKDQISIKHGVEFGLQPHLIEKYSLDASNYNFDFIICSIHAVEKTDLYKGNFFINKKQLDAYSVYFQELEQVVDGFDDYSVLGHLDVIKRYGSFDISLPLDDYREFLTPLLKKIIHKGKGIELNTSGIRYMLGDYHPSLDTLKLYHSLGGEIITVGSDAHQIPQVAFDFPNALKALSEIGFKYITTFDQRVPKFHSISKLIV